MILFRTTADNAASCGQSQRALSSSSRPSGEPSAARLNMAAVISTAIAAGSIAWYYRCYGPVAHAMTPAEEGYVILDPGFGFPGLRQMD